MNPLQQRLQAATAAKKQSGLERRLRVPAAEVLDLASNDYLGLAKHPAVIAAVQEATAQFGAGGRASRLVSGQTALHEELEHELAAYKGCEAALLFPSGYMANLSVITALAHSGDLILCDKRNHASLIDGCRLAESNGAQVRYYGSIDKARRLLLKSYETRQPDSQIFIVSDAVYSMDGDLCDLPALLALIAEFDATLILDDAHGTGTLGETGRGAVEHFGLMHAGGRFALQEKVIQVGTLSKALGSQGGFASGPRWLVDWLVNAGRPFIYTTALNPASCGAALAALQLLQREQQLLKRLGEVEAALVEGLIKMGYDVRAHESPVLPIFIGDAERAVALSAELLEAGVWCPAIRPPTVPRGASRLRVTASAALTAADVQRALYAFAAVQSPLNMNSKK